MPTPLDYAARLTIEEAEARYQEVRNEFDGVRRNYAGILARFRSTMNEEDKKTLADCVGVLLPLGMQKVVQEEYLGRRNDVNALFVRAQCLTQDIMVYLARFKNTGVEILQGSLE